MHVEKRWRLIIDIHNKLKQTIVDYLKEEADRVGSYPINAADDYTSVSTIVALLRLLQEDPASAGLDSLSSKLTGKTKILSAVESLVKDGTYSQRAAELCKIEKGIIVVLTKLRSEINREATSGAKLKRKCHYLGYENAECG